MKDKFLHLLQDSSYSNWIIQHFETVAPGVNDYFIFSSSGRIRNVDLVNKIQIISDVKLKKNLNGYKKVIVQYLDNNASYFLIQNIPFSEFDKIVWVLWGGDFYFIPGDEKRIYQRYGWNFLYKNRRLIKKVYYYFINRYRWLLDKPSLMHRLKAIKLIEVCASGILKDVDYIENRFAKKFTIIKEFRFLPLELMFGKDFLTFNSKGFKIIVGNSADPANNHYEAFHLIAKEKLTNQVACPLTYGIVAYKELILQEGKKILGKQFEPQCATLPKDEYYNNLQDIGFAIYNHNMQMGVGNLIGLFWLGVKIFMNEDNPLFQEFKDWGLCVFSLQKDFSCDAFETKLNEASVLHNRNIILEKYSKENVLRLHKNLLG